MELNYFTCTLGEAAIHRKTDPSFANIPSFIEQQGQRMPDTPAVGFYSPSALPGEQWDTHVLSFADVHRGSVTVADILSRSSKQGFSSSETVALLCPSTADFLFAWLGLLRLGHRVLLLAPQLAAPAIANLCQQCDVGCLLYDEQYRALARATGNHMASQEEIEFWIFDIGSVMGKNGVFDTIKHEPDSVPKDSRAHLHDTAFYFHTSGTSSGLPKPIPQSHYAAAGVLPRLDGTTTATFTTTPLYHGGIADLFRAWSSDSMIWLFPGKGTPITASNIVRCLAASKTAQTHEKTPPISFFSSVPYVLQMMEQDRHGLRQLQDMDIVGVGGAALPDEVGHRLVKQGVSLISRFGSAECGFVLSSHRDYRHDGDWQYLRDYTRPSETRGGADDCADATLRSNGAANKLQEPLVRFEPRDGGLFELIILPTWPHRAKTNRPDGSYATSDLFEPHASIANAWRYHSRADAQLTLITGKKFDPAPLEAAIAASSPSVSDAFVFGEGKSYPGVLVFRSEPAAAKSNADVMKDVWPAIQKLNQDSQAHTRLGRHTVTIMPHEKAGLEKSSKGTLIRNKISERFASAISHTYERMDGVECDIPDKDVTKYILNSIEMIIGSDHLHGITTTTDLYNFGFDSVASIQLRKRLGRLLPEAGSELPLSVVEDFGTPEKLADYITRRRRGESVDTDDDEEQLMLDLVEKYAHFDPGELASETAATNGHGDVGTGEVVVLTGATGALGAHVLDHYRRNPDVARVYCLVRGSDPLAARERVSKALSQRGLQDLSALATPLNEKVLVLQCQLADPHLGLSQGDYARILHTATTIVHLAWAVNFRLKLHHFEREHIAGTKHLLDLAVSIRRAHHAGHDPSFVFCSSTASCTGLQRQPEHASDSDSCRSVIVPEDIIHDPSAASGIGYGRSKWVAEAIVNRATLSTTGTGLRKAAVLRVGQLSGDTERGIWNRSEAWPMMLQSVSDTGALPALQDQSLDWLPVDIAAQAVVEAGEALKHRDGEAVVFHVLNPHRQPTWMDMLGWVKELHEFEVLEPERWIERLEAFSEEHPDHPALRLLGLWKEAYAGARANATRRLSFETKVTGDALPVLRNVKPLDNEHFQKIWQWLQADQETSNT